MINEIYVIQESGIPIYYYNYDQIKDGVQIKDDFFMLQAGFFAAMVQFGSELTQDELKYIVFNRRTYGVKKSKQVYIIFNENKEMDTDMLKLLDKKLDVASSFLNESLAGKNIDISYLVNTSEMDSVVNSFSRFLVDEKIIANTSPIDTSKVKSQVRNFVFKAVGYEPGKCNIGPKERMLRLTMGMISIAFGMLLFALFVILDLPEWSVLFLIIPFFMGFIGIYQYFFRFCVSNALQKQYKMT